MPATNVTDYFFEAKPLWVGKVGAAGVASPTAETIPLQSAANLTNGNAYVVTVNRTDAAGTVKNPANERETFIGKLSGSNFINCVRQVEGEAQAWEADTVVEILATATTWNKFIEGFEQEHNADGSHSDINANSITSQTIEGDSVLSGAISANESMDVDGDPVVTEANVQDISNKNITDSKWVKRVVSAAKYTTSVATNSDATDILVITAQDGALEFSNPTGTPVQGQMLAVRIKDDGTARALTYGSQFRAIGTELPSTTVISKTLYMLFMFNSTDTKWDLLSVNQQE